MGTRWGSAEPVLLVAPEGPNYKCDHLPDIQDGSHRRCCISSIIPTASWPLSWVPGWKNFTVREGWGAEVLVPVPLSKHRAQKRGFNQAALLADALSSRIDLPVDSSSLLRIQDTRSQVGLGPHERWKNVEHVFKVRSQSLKDMDVLIVDDLFTTGATLSACAVAIRASGARSVTGLTVARA